ncbi:MAG: hypothetical protein JXA82_01645 [Sedimentisphaerales bacterium]|nr:hypothetical protein [Sedimentisphaerales bacterium]
MVKLQTRAWIELAVAVWLTVISAGCFVLLVKLNSRGMDTLLIGGITGLIGGLIIAVHQTRVERQFDEREKQIRHKAFTWSAMGFVVLFGVISFAAFFTVGGKGTIPVYFLPALFFGCLLFAQFVQSAVILIQCAQESNDG